MFRFLNLGLVSSAHRLVEISNRVMLDFTLLEFMGMDSVPHIIRSGFMVNLKHQQPLEGVSDLG